ncbi:alpha/beta hydrolase fold domain-containing protein [Variovorax arabinosiphilus]|uniref:alpha/beta hydrolase fold domain-containing protein n=1 Tax=Variovorax arabinosiphilus TaxID=3053498 RepID=UPI002576D245|nr:MULTISPECIES: alpha/beta hydrolase fold domain-containing protein [unclassified Variovorax]MDM0122419.1 alpha/beta hydrolase fold domain-containing protein [Variovorax sp. J2L1-78]MDM0131052.1 alpha/beta hydrolase fold domain-containing protein [Variovorax sp. J2L1-63]MDM0235182.1 alpha/beta hydrolase fold domain-containing protein [Variovorax sp. J2R1-6]
MRSADPAISVPIPTRSKLDPQVEQFVRAMDADASRFGRRETVSIAEARDIAETVRRRWVEGGPVMANSVEHTVPTRHGEVLIRAHYPQVRALPGVFVYLHGGGFVLGSLDTHDRVMREYAQRAGIVVIGVHYTRAPEAKFPRPMQECADVLRWVSAHGELLAVDTSQLFVGGDSAGAIFSMGASLEMRDRGEALLKGIVLNYGSMSSNLCRNSVIQYGGGDYGLSLMSMVWFRAMHFTSGADFTDPRIDILRADLRGLPPTWMVVAECDPVHDDMIELDRLMREAGNDVRKKVYPGAAHSFLEAVSISDLAVEAFEDTARWLREKSAA